MSTALPTSEQSMSTPDLSPSAFSPQSQPSKPQRVLACVRCQQRKVKCNRVFPCTNCNISHVQCVPAVPTRRGGRRRRRFPERELLERLRKYEDLLRQNNIKFEPAHDRDESDDEQPEAVGTDWSSPSATIKSERVFEAKDLWHALNSGVQDSDEASNSSQDDVSDLMFRKGWVQLFGHNDHLLFGSPQADIDLATLHPEPVYIFRLWQIYLDNVNPLLKVTHTPSLQGRIIEASSNLKDISPTLEVLMFSIYCMAILSLVADDCKTIFGSSQEDLLSRFQFGCRQALLKCGFLRSSNRDCLTALYLYLVSVRSSTVPQSLSAMLGIAIRIAQRMGIDNESALAKCTVFEAELRRRLWWSLVLFDTRISELASHKTATLAPTWDCRVPLNVNDSDLRPEMKEPPAVQGKSTDAVFVVVRSELGEFVRHTHFHLDFTNPALKPIFKTAEHDLIPEAAELVNLESLIEKKYLRNYDPENPLHFMTIWWTRAYLAKCRLVEHLSNHSDSPVHQTDAQRDVAITHALRMLECDTKFASSPLAKGFLWLVNCHFPFPAYIQILQDLRRRPSSERAEQAWETMSDNYEARFLFRYEDDSPFFTIFVKMVLPCWAAREAAFSKLGESLMPPRIVLSLRKRIAKVAQDAQVAKTAPPNGVIGIGMDDLPMLTPMPTGYGNHDLLYNLGGPGGYGVNGSGVYPNLPGQDSLDVDANNLDWTTMDWSFGSVYPELWDTQL